MLQCGGDMLLCFFHLMHVLLCVRPNNCLVVSIPCIILPTV